MIYSFCLKKKKKRIKRRKSSNENSDLVCTLSIVDVKL